MLGGVTVGNISELPSLSRSLELVTPEMKLVSASIPCPTCADMSTVLRRVCADMMVDEGVADIVIVGTLFDKKDRPPPPPSPPPPPPPLPTTDTDWLKSKWFKKSAAERDAVADRESEEDTVDATAMLEEE